MQPKVVLISATTVDFKTFIGLSYKVLGYSPAAGADACPRELSDTERYLSCLAAVLNPQAQPGLSPSLLTHASYGVFIVADDRDMLDILQCAAGMPFVLADTTARGVQAAVITGTLGQWRDAVKSGSTPTTEANVRLCYNRIFALFEGAGVNLWTDQRSRPAPDQVTFLLEDKRK